MAKIKRSLTAVILPLLVVLSFTLGGLFPPLHDARSDPGVLYAAPATQGSGDCSSWADACTLQTALDQVVSNDEIWVQAGVHYPGAVGQREATFALQSSVAIYGGFAGWESELSQRDWIANITVLSGDIGQDDLTDPNGVVTDTVNIQGENAYHVVMGSGVTETAVLDGFAITAGQARGGDYPHYVGGGMHNDGSSPTLDNVTFSGNTAYGGGGMSNWYNSSPTLSGVTFRGNVVTLDGGGMYNDNSSPTLKGVTFSNNVAFLHDDYVSKGGGMYNVISSPTLTGVSFSGNSASSGGGMYNWHNSSPTLTDVTFSGNIGNHGGGMYNDNNSSPTLTDITFSGNTGGNGGGMWNRDNSNPTLADVTFSGNTAGHGGGMWNYDNSNPMLANVLFIGNSALRGGGMYNDESSPTLTGVTFSANSANETGGGIYNVYNSSPTLTGVNFSGNSAGEGGGMFNSDSDPLLADVTFSSNFATHGGGMYNRYNSSPTVTNTIFSGNSADNYGGGICNYWQSNPVLTNVTFSGNSATSGGGIYNWNYCSPTMVNISISGNSAGENGGGIYHYNNSNSMLTNVIIWGNTAPNGAGMYNDTSTPQISYSDIQECGGSGSWNSACGTDGGGNIDADPLFVDAPNGDLHLQLASQAIDAGDNTALPPDILADLDGNPRYVDIPTVPDTGNGAAPIVDMGAYEAQCVDLTLSKAVLPPEAAPGETITFTLTLTNAGSLPATGIVVTDTLPALLWGVSFTSTLLVTDTGYLPLYVWRAQDLAPGQGGVITASGVLTTPLAAGTYTNTAFISAAGDLHAENDTAVITFSVPNLAPVFTSTPMLTAMEDAPYTYATTAQDDNGDALILTAPTPLPAWLTLEDHGDGTATLSGTPSNTDVGEHAVELHVNDGGGLTSTQSFTVTVANVNDTPVFTSTPVLTATKETPYTYAVAADDPDLIHGDALTITALTLPGWLTLEDHGDGTATLSGTPDSLGDYPVNLQVTDRLGVIVEQSFTITVGEKPRYYTFLPLMLRSAP